MAEDDNPPAGPPETIGPPEPPEPATDPREHQIGMGGATAPPDLNDPERRKCWGLPESETEPGHYMVELNVGHRGGIKAAALRLKQIYKEVVSRRVIRQPVSVGQTYFHCHLSVHEWRRLVK